MNKVFISLLTGIGIGILVAPGKGSKTRAKLADGLNGLANKINRKSTRKKSNKMYHDALDTIEEQIRRSDNAHI